MIWFIVHKILKKLFNVIPINFQLYREYDFYYKNTRISEMVFQTEGDLVHLILFNEIYWFRKFTSDFKVFDQVLINKEYFPVVDFLINNKIEITNFIDCGANIGLTSRYFLHYFKDLKGLAIEPDPSNFSVMKKNLANYDNFMCINKALWKNNDELYLNYKGDGDYWSISVSGSKFPKGSSGNLVPSITLKEVFDFYDFIDLFKLDIEGSEFDVFSQIDNLNYLSRVKILVIEIHETSGKVNDLVNKIISFNFFVFRINEFYMFLNKKYFPKS